MQKIKKQMIFDWLDELAEYKFSIYDNVDDSYTFEKSKLDVILNLCDKYDFNLEKAFIDSKVYGVKVFDKSK